jgi:NAD-dependent dihydropyrimidine dehydrogenase PreA subunit
LCEVCMDVCPDEAIKVEEWLSIKWVIN